MDWGRALAAIIISIIVNVQLVAAGMWPPLELRAELAELASQTLNPEIYQIFSREQVEWMLRVWDSQNKYVVVDKLGRLWTVGQGSMPEPLRAALYNKSLDAYLAAAAGVTGWGGWFVKVVDSARGYIERWYVRPDSPLDVMRVVDSDTIFTRNSPEGGTYPSPLEYNWSPPWSATDIDGITLYFGGAGGGANYIRYDETAVCGGQSCTIAEWIVDVEAVGPGGHTVYELGIGFIFDKNSYVSPTTAYCTVSDASGTRNITITTETSLYWTAVYCNVLVNETARVHIYMEWPNRYGSTNISIGNPPPPGESQPPEPPPPGELPQDEVNQTVCEIRQIDRTSLPLIQNGQIGGNGGAGVEWIIAKNIKSPYWPASTDLDDYWRAAVGWTWANLEPRSCNFTFYTPYGSELDLIDESFTFDWGEWPAFRHSDVLPDEAGQYVFVWFVRLDYNGTRYIWITYTNVTINTNGDANPVVRALKNAFSSAISAFLALLKKLLPDEIEQLTGYAWQYFKAIVDVFKQMFNYIPWLADILRLLIFLMPAVIVAILIYDPFRLIDFFRFIFRMLLEVVQFIRSLLPI